MTETPQKKRRLPRKVKKRLRAQYQRTGSVTIRLRGGSPMTISLVGVYPTPDKTPTTPKGNH